MAKDDIKKYQIKKGEVLNPTGRPKSGVRKLNDELEANGYKKLSKSDIEQLYSYLIDCTAEELKQIANDENRTMVIRIVAKQILSKDGFNAIETMLNRMHGKPSQTQILAGDNENPLNMSLNINIVGHQLPHTDYIKPE